MKKDFAVFGMVAVLFTTVGVMFGMQRTVPASATSTAVSTLLSQSMPDAGGRTQQLSQWKGKALVVNFWATWCAPCVEEMPELSALQAEIAPNIQVLGIGIDSHANIVEFTKKYRISYPLYVSGMGGTELSRRFGNEAGGLPFTVLIGADGEVKKTYLGRLKMDMLQQDLKAL